MIHKIGKQFKEMGRDIFLRGFISSHAGNMSIRVKDKIYITRRSSCWSRLQQKDVIELELGQDNSHTYGVIRLIVHTEIYKATRTHAIIHTHPPFATLLSMVEDEIIPVDSEGLYVFKKAPVVSPKKTIGSEESAYLVSEQLKKNRIAIVHEDTEALRKAIPSKRHSCTQPALNHQVFFCGI